MKRTVSAHLDSARAHEPRVNRIPELRNDNKIGDGPSCYISYPILHLRLMDKLCYALAVDSLDANHTPGSAVHGQTSRAAALGQKSDLVALTDGSTGQLDRLRSV